jgi:hypothetical protein
MNTIGISKYVLDPYQYSIVKGKGLVYKDIDFNKLIPAHTAVKRSANDITALSYHRFTANEGYFNSKSDDLWYYTSKGGPALNVQDTRHIIFPEPTRGGINSQSLCKYSKDCEFFDYNSNLQVPFERVYSLN